MPDIGKDKLTASKEVYFPSAEVVVDCSTLTNEEWLAYRRKGIGGSDVAAIFGVSPWVTTQALYHEKVGTKFLMPENEDDKWFIFEYGHLMEDLVAQAFQKRTGFDILVDTRMYRHPVHKFMQADIDRLVILPDGRKAILECKTTTFFNKDAWSDGPPRYYKLQCMHYMAVCNVDVCYIACIFGNTINDFVCHRIERDLEEEALMIEAEKEFWEGNVLSMIEPDVSGDGEMDIELIRKLTGYADVKIPPMPLDPSYIKTIEKYIELDEKRKTLEKQAEEIKNLQKTMQTAFWEEMGKATKGEIDIPKRFIDDPDEYFEVSISPRSRTSVDTEKMKLVYPEVYKECVFVNPENSRVFSVKRKKRKKKK